jgi:5-hydroxyisourate hydrolase
MPKLTTHILDTSAGTPAGNFRIDLLRGHLASAVLIKTVHTNADGRTDSPLLEGPDFAPGHYTLLFHAAEYFRHRGHPDAGKFLDAIPIQFVIADPPANHHVPLLLSPWSYSTYRGS